MHGIIYTYVHRRVPTCNHTHNHIFGYFQSCPFGATLTASTDPLGHIATAIITHYGTHAGFGLRSHYLCLSVCLSVCLSPPQNL